MTAHLRSRQRPARVQPLRVGPAPRMLMLAAALAAALALMPRAHAQDNPAQGNGQNAPNAAAQKDNANGAPARKTAAQRSQEDAQRLLGSPSMANGGQGDSSSFSAMQTCQRPGRPCVACSRTCGWMPNPLRTRRPIARGIVALGRKPGPKQPLPACSGAAGAWPRASPCWL